MKQTTKSIHTQKKTHPISFPMPIPSLSKSIMTTRNEIDQQAAALRKRGYLPTPELCDAIGKSRSHFDKEIKRSIPLTAIETLDDGAKFYFARVVVDILVERALKNSARGRVKRIRRPKRSCASRNLSELTSKTASKNSGSRKPRRSRRSRTASSSPWPKPKRSFSRSRIGSDNSPIGVVDAKK